MIKKTKAEYDPRSVPIGIHTWELPDSSERLHAIINLIVKEAMAIATKEYQCSAWFPAEYGDIDGCGSTDERRDQPPSDPTTIFVELPIGPNEDDNPRWSFKLSDLVDRMIEYVEQGEGGPISGETDREPLAKVAADLRRLSNVLNEALARK